MRYPTPTCPSSECSTNPVALSIPTLQRVGNSARFVNIFIGLLVARWLLRPVARLNQAAESIEKGEFDETVLVDLTHRKDEMGQMARVFQRMGSIVAARELELRERMTLLQAETDRAKQAAAAAKLGQGIDVQELLHRARQLRSQGANGGYGNGQVNLRQISYLKGLGQTELERLSSLGQQRTDELPHRIGGWSFCLFLCPSCFIAPQDFEVALRHPRLTRLVPNPDH